MCVYRQELESVTSKFQLHVCRFCEKTAHSTTAATAAPAQISLDLRNQLHVSCDQPRPILDHNHKHQNQRKLEIPARETVSQICDLYIVAMTDECVARYNNKRYNKK